jgi:hypothetical protein
MLVSVLVLDGFVQRVGNDRNHFVALRDPVVSSIEPSRRTWTDREICLCAPCSRTAGHLPARVDTRQMQRAGILQQNGRSRIPSTRELPHDEGRIFLIASDEIVLTACSNTLQ